MREKSIIEKANDILNHYFPCGVSEAPDKLEYILCANSVAIPNIQRLGVQITTAVKIVRNHLESIGINTSTVTIDGRMALVYITAHTKKCTERNME